MPEPAVPPTPPVPLTSLLAREDLALRQIAGPRDAGVTIHWAHTSEMADPYPYLLGGELLLTAGVHIPQAAGRDESLRDHDGSLTDHDASLAAHDASLTDSDESLADSDEGLGDYFDAYVSRIVEAGGAALGFGVAPVHDTVPRALVEACEAHGLPLLEVPPQTTFSGVARAVWQLMAQARLAELRRVTEAQQSLAAAAARPDPVPAVLRQLAQRVGGRAVLYGPDGARIAEAGREQPEEAMAPLAELAAVVTHRSTTTATDTAAGVHLAAYALGAGQGFALGVAAPQRDPADHTIASVAAVLLTLLTGEHQSGTGAARSSALVRLLLGATPEEVAPLVGAGRAVVVHARPEAQSADAMAASALGAALGSPLVDLADGTVRVLVAADREVDAHPGWTLGVSAPAAPADWPAADAQAARALARARATRTPLIRHGARPALTDLFPPQEAAAHARALLAPLNPVLIETLRTWLSLHGSWDRTAVALSVHRNTVRQRVARCATLLNTDLDDADVRMELWFALRQV
ncbi:PucR family transcriptional regulator [Streptomyces sp. NPDC058731]|uniref:PucR family transcriptional regulator n=1 Tax=Streptomyces sp. NPDC058731 TaxID=3346613 RepID=UPI0036A68E69